MGHWGSVANPGGPEAAAGGGGGGGAAAAGAASGGGAGSIMGAAGGRDITHVFHSPRSGGTMSPKNRRLSWNPKCGGGDHHHHHQQQQQQNESFKVYQYQFASDRLEAQEALGMVESDVCLLKLSTHSNNDNNHHNHNHSNNSSSKNNKLQAHGMMVEQSAAGFVSDFVGHFWVHNSSSATRMTQIFTRKRGFRQSGFYIFALLLLTFLLVKITSGGWLSIESQNYSSTPQVGLISSFSSCLCRILPLDEYCKISFFISTCLLMRSTILPKAFSLFCNDATQRELVKEQISVLLKWKRRTFQSLPWKYSPLPDSPQ